MKKVIRIATLFVASTISVVALAQLQNPTDDLRNNPEYVELQHKDRELEMREDSVVMVLGDVRESFRIYADSLNTVGEQPSTEDYSRFSDRILELEQLVFDIRTMRGDIIARINAMEQEWVLVQMNAPIELAMTEMEGEKVVELPKYRNLVENHCIKDVLGNEDYAELLDAQREDAEMDALVAAYHDLYARMSSAVDGYRTTNVEAEAEELFAEFHTLKAEAEALAEKIESRWNHILDTKYYAYGYVLEHDHSYDLLDASSEEFMEMRRECSREAGYYAADALMHYALGRPTLRSFEHNFARTMELEEAADSIATAKMMEVNYRLEPLSIERRLFIDYEPIIIGRTNYYKDTNPIPEVKVYERGTIYRIRLGEFRSKQPMTLFKGVQPLYITRNEKGNYVYYAGGFATRHEADEAQLFLKEKGFKAPEICRWLNGEMVNITRVERDEDESVDVAVVGKRYMIKIGGEALSEEVRAVIANEAPRKSVSKEGDGFVLGTFDSSDEVELLVSLIEECTDVPVTIVEIEINE